MQGRMNHAENVYEEIENIHRQMNLLVMYHTGLGIDTVDYLNVEK